MDERQQTNKIGKKMNELANYIKENAISWSINYSSEEEIDEINILQATQCMKECIQNILDSPKTSSLKINLLIDGNYFKPGNLMLKYKQLKEIACIKGGDHTFTCIAAASILAKHARDEYIKELCEENKELIERYNIGKIRVMVQSAFRWNKTIWNNKMAS